MYLTAKLKLQTSPEQSDALRSTLVTFNAACNWISEHAWKTKIFRQFTLQKECYRDVRQRFGLTAQSAVHAVRKVADSYKLDKAVMRTFRASGAASYDNRILSWKLSESSVSIWSIKGRLGIPFVCGGRQRAILAHRKGETNLALVRGKWYLMATCQVPDTEPIQASAFLGVDLGVANIASDSDGKTYSGKAVKAVRHRHRRLRTKLDKKQTRAAKRRLKKIAGKERRFARHENHVISKEIVASAERTGRGIAIEELTGIRARIRASREQRAVLHSWAFAQLGTFITYKARLAGVPLVIVDPRNTSRECAECGHVSKKSRPDQSTFHCVACLHAANADTNAARVISSRATSKLAEGDRARLSDYAAVSHG